MLAFFTVHFGGFHVGHGAFLNEFLPLVKGADASPAAVFAAAGVALRSYWMFIAATFVSRLRDFPITAKDLKEKGCIMQPYINVVRMHVLILVFAGLHEAGLSRFAIYPVLVFYFVPWGALIQHANAERKARKDNAR